MFCDQTSTSAFQITAAATANVHARTSTGAENVATVHLGGRMLGRRAATVGAVKCLSDCRCFRCCSGTNCFKADAYKRIYIRVCACWLDINECASNNGGCHSKRQCTNTAGSRTCGNCAAGWINNGATGCTGVYLLLICVSVQKYN